MKRKNWHSVIACFAMFIIPTFVLFISCNDQPNDNPPSNNPETFVEFKNLEQFPVTIYSDPGRNDEVAKIEPECSKTIPFEPAPMGIAFYPTFYFSKIIGSTKITIPFNGSVIVSPVKKNITNLVPIPPLESIKLKNAYIYLINNSNYSLSLREGSSERIPYDESSTLIGSGLSAVYEIEPGAISRFLVMRNALEAVNYPENLIEFKEGIIYTLTFNGTYLMLTEVSDIFDDDENGIKWSDDVNGTLNVINNTSKDMILFLGTTLWENNKIGGIRASTSKDFNIAAHVFDFQVGGYSMMCGLSRTEYNANKNNLSLAKIDYFALITYGQGKKFKTEISPFSMGNCMYRISNQTHYLIELRNGFSGEKIGFIPASAINRPFFANSTNIFPLFPVFVFYDRRYGLIATFGDPSLSIIVSPGLNNGGQISTYVINPQYLQQPKFLAAYIFVTNNSSTQNCKVKIIDTVIKSQNGFDSIGAGETFAYEIPLPQNPDGSILDRGYQYIYIQFSVFGDLLDLPIRFEGNNTPPIIENGCVYSVNVNLSDAISGSFKLLESGVRLDPNDYFNAFQ
jgi:hypothetical protein